MAKPMTVVEARGGTLKPGMRVEESASVALRSGEKLVLIGSDGRAVTLQGVYNGPAARAGAAAQNPRAALAALISVRNDRASSVGAVRSGANAAALPDPWLVDISRPGQRCVREGEPVVWWRPEARTAQDFTMFPLDRSWRADLGWAAGQDHMTAPKIARLAGSRFFLIRQGEQENAIAINIIPKDVTDPLVVSSWMLEKACVQQADAYFRQLQAQLPAPTPADEAAGGAKGAAQ